MNVIDGAALFYNMAMFIAVAIALAVTFTYLLRGAAVRDRFPGGAKRYLAALIVQAAGFMIPIPVVLVLLIGPPIPEWLDVVLAVAAGVLTLAVLRYAPVTGPLLRDLHELRMQLALERAARGGK